MLRQRQHGSTIFLASAANNRRLKAYVFGSFGRSYVRPCVVNCLVLRNEKKIRCEENVQKFSKNTVRPRHSDWFTSANDATQPWHRVTIQLTSNAQSCNEVLWWIEWTVFHLSLSLNYCCEFFLVSVSLFDSRVAFRVYCFDTSCSLVRRWSHRHFDNNRFLSLTEYLL